MLKSRIPLEKQVCTVEQAKQLVALGADLDSFTCWVTDTMNPHWNNGYALSRLGWEAMQLLRASDVQHSPRATATKFKGKVIPDDAPKEIWPAYTAAELAQLAGGDYYATFYAYDKWYYIDLRNECPFRVAQDKQQRRAYDTEAQARAAMAIDILTNKGALEYCRTGHEMPFGLPL
jgi:hypothetical protein